MPINLTEIVTKYQQYGTIRRNMSMYPSHVLGKQINQRYKLRSASFIMYRAHNVSCQQIFTHNCCDLTLNEH
jgi:hypothetical protein